ncbi:hypothetical protein JXI42_02935 [bacterium]|nr:hypothetical protein [bacterium]
MLIASIPQLVSYQGHLADESGDPLIGSHTLTFRLYDTEAGGSAIWSEIHTVELDSVGLYSLMLGSISSFASAGVDFSVPYWMSLSVDGSAELGRHQVGASPYSFHAHYADSLSGIYNYVKSINEVDPDEMGNIELLEGDNVTITEMPGSNAIEISSECPPTPEITIDGVLPDESSNIDLIEGANINIDAIPDSNKIRISATGGAAGGMNSVNEVPPDGDGNLQLIEGENITITEIPDSNKIRIDSRDYPHPNRVILGNDTEHGALQMRNQSGQVILIAETDPASQGLLVVTPNTMMQALGVAASGEGTYNAISAMTESPGNDVAGVYGLANTGGRSYGLKGLTMSSADSSAGVLGMSGGGLTYGVYGITGSEDWDAAGVFGRSLNNGNGVLGITASENTTVAGVQGIAEDGIGVMGEGIIGVVGIEDIFGTAAIISDGKFIVGDIEVENTAMIVDPLFNSTSIYGTGDDPITIFGGASNRVAIQKVNNGPTPTIPDNNFTIAAEAPLLLTNGAHGVTISCPECCEEPCGGGSGCLCEGTMVVGGGGSDGEIVTRYSGGGDMNYIDRYGISSADVISSGGDTHVGGNLYVTGTKGFLVQHPEMDDKSILFTCAESDEVMIQHRGLIELSEGYGETKLPHEFILMSEPGTYSIMCTPQARVDPGRIAALVTDDGKVQIHSFDGPEILKVAFVVYSSRAGYKDQRVVIPTDELMSWKKHKAIREN